MGMSYWFILLKNYHYSDTMFITSIRGKKDGRIYHYFSWFRKNYCTYQSEDGKCFILDFWVFPEFRGSGMGHRCFEAFEKYTRLDGAEYYELNAEKENSIRFWKSLGFVENGKDEYDMLLLIKK